MRMCETEHDHRCADYMRELFVYMLLDIRI